MLAKRSRIGVRAFQLSKESTAFGTSLAGLRCAQSFVSSLSVSIQKDPATVGMDEFNANVLILAENISRGKSIIKTGKDYLEITHARAAHSIRHFDAPVGGRAGGGGGVARRAVPPSQTGAS